MDEINSILLLLIVLAIWEVVKSIFIFFKVNSDISRLEVTASTYKQRLESLSKAYNHICNNVGQESANYLKEINRLSETEKELRAERNNLLKIVEELTPKEKVVKADKPFPDPNFLRKKPKIKKKV